jgi:hypothetical protein
MTTSDVSSLMIGRLAIVTGVAGLLALALLILLFVVGQPFGTLNDIFIALTAILSAGLAWVLYSQHQAHSSGLSQIGLVLALVGAAVVAIGSVLVVLGIAGWFLAGLYMAAGNALIGVWVLTLNCAARQSNSLPDNLAIFGIVVGIVMILGLAAMPGIFSRMDSWDAAPWYVSYIGQSGALGYLVLYPIWCVWLGRTLLPQ